MFEQYLITLGWGITGAITMAIALPLLLWVFDKFTPIDEWAEIKRGNLGLSIIISSLIIGFALVMALSILPGNS